MLCWLVWGRRWQIQALLPALCLIAATALKIYTTCQPYSMVQSYFKYLVLHAGPIPASTLWCAWLMIYLILTVTRGAPAQGEGPYWHFLEVFVGFGIAQTLLVERVAAGHVRPDDSWKGSVMTSPLRFGQDKTEKTSLMKLNCRAIYQAVCDLRLSNPDAIKKYALLEFMTIRRNYIPVQSLLLAGSKWAPRVGGGGVCTVVDRPKTAQIGRENAQSKKRTKDSSESACPASSDTLCFQWLCRALDSKYIGLDSEPSKCRIQTRDILVHMRRGEVEDELGNWLGGALTLTRQTIVGGRAGSIVGARRHRRQRPRRECIAIQNFGHLRTCRFCQKRHRD
ncbi:hypothetical protein ARMGADRAFT_1032580 [Armillaria gallica]|uniref:Uncharacterized protein n=1 Tax=Armillaria gallica TaxID=47427 RepID=A0A2H3DGK0_ARMGA|nr:hypothetical protein ARMGADRAFT_1032580 [Armillaria gallica]